ncbi:hypothetical protein [Ancylobacter radicis]|uniref:Uncharacterized protein n=1 Tax=Ancylobacter radicis TaxID=2836179 RepID=A0ABS5R3E2_9HYPH|nr:hypothetical protein [Ancylobacter radicis]MBS9476178.1 hypothetical protein [Ancylobacter radicis]
MTTGPCRVQIKRSATGETIIPKRAIRVDKASPWWPPFDISHPYIGLLRSLYLDDRKHKSWMLAHMYRRWITGELVNDVSWYFMVPVEVRRQLYVPPGIVEIKTKLAGRDLADWPPIGWPCIGDVLLSLANQAPDGTPYPTPSDDFIPVRRPRSDRRGGAALSLYAGR